MKHKSITLFVAVALMLSLCSCTSSPTVSTDTPGSAEPDTPSSAQPAEPSHSAAEGEDTSSRMAAYQFALQQICFEHVYPDGTDTSFDGAYGFIEDNAFALIDVTGDGKEELLVRFITAPVEKKAEVVYTYDDAADCVTPILTVSAEATFFEDGMVKENWLYGSELAGEGYWPYNLYRYNAALKRYEEIAQVNMWSKAVDVVDLKGDPYPEDIDAEGAGTVFIVDRGSVVETISQSAYESWLADTLTLTAELDVPYQSLSEENIKSLY